MKILFEKKLNNDINKKKVILQKWCRIITSACCSLYVYIWLRNRLKVGIIANEKSRLVSKIYLCLLNHTQQESSLFESLWIFVTIDDIFYHLVQNKNFLIIKGIDLLFHTKWPRFWVQINCLELESKVVPSNICVTEQWGISVLHRTKSHTPHCKDPFTITVTPINTQ